MEYPGVWAPEARLGALALRTPSPPPREPLDPLPFHDPASSSRRRADAASAASCVASESHEGMSILVLGCVTGHGDNGVVCDAPGCKAFTRYEYC